MTTPDGGEAPAASDTSAELQHLTRWQKTTLVGGAVLRTVVGLALIGWMMTLVPDDPSQATSDHGWDFKAELERLKPIVARLKKGGMRVSLFADADPAQVEAAKATGTDRIELYTGPYGGCYDDSEKAAKLLEMLGKTADAAIGAGLGVNAGHDLTVANLPALAGRIPRLAEVSIGHGLTADALEFGMAQTVRRFLAACGW